MQTGYALKPSSTLFCRLRVSCWLYCMLFYTKYQRCRLQVANTCIMVNSLYVNIAVCVSDKLVAVFWSVSNEEVCLPQWQPLVKQSYFGTCGWCHCDSPCLSLFSWLTAQYRLWCTLCFSYPHKHVNRLFLCHIYLNPKRDYACCCQITHQVKTFSR